MSMTANLHRVVTMRAIQSNGTAWLHIENQDGNAVSVFMPYDTAKRIVAAFVAKPQECGHPFCGDECGTSASVDAAEPAEGV